MKLLKHFWRKIFPIKSEDGFIGYWGVYDTESGLSKTKGEMYSLNGKWIKGPELWEDKAPEI